MDAGMSPAYDATTGIIKGPSDFRGLSMSQVLLVSADTVCSDALRAALEDSGVSVVGAESFPAALNQLEHGTHGVVFLDSDCVGGDAVRFVGQVRKRYPDRIVIVTGEKPGTNLLIKLIHNGVHEFVSKPFDANKLAAGIRVICQKRERAGSESGVGEGAVGTESGDDPRRLEASGDVFLANEQLQNTNETLRRQVSQFTILYQMGRDISESENWTDALDRFLMALVNYTGAEGAALLLFSRKGTRLAARSSFQIDDENLNHARRTLSKRWRDNPRGSEIHSIESYEDHLFATCLERLKRWRFTVVPLRYRNRAWGFLFIEKTYKSNNQFRIDYPFFTTIQTILAEEVANASYISELRQLSRFNQKVLDNINSGVITTDLEGYALFWNHLALKMCPGLSEGARVHFDELFRSDSRSGGLFQTIMDGKKVSHVLEVRYLGGGGQERPARISITKMHDDNLNGNVLVGIFEDLTEQKRLEEEIRRNDRLRVLGRLSAGVAHEIRNPLTGIATSAEILYGRLARDDDKTKYVRAILDETSRLDEIIRNLLNFAKPAKPQMCACVPGDISRRVVGLVSDHAEKKGIEIKVRDELNDDVCHADANQLTQVLLNVVLNAIDACDHGNTVEIVLKKDPATEGMKESGACITISDDGPGVPEEVRMSLFEPFVTTKTHGTGLGLAICQQIIEEHHGVIGCEFLEKGTRFTVRLPLKHRDAVGKIRANRSTGE